MLRSARQVEEQTGEQEGRLRRWLGSIFVVSATVSSAVAMGLCVGEVKEKEGAGERTSEIVRGGLFVAGR